MDALILLLANSRKLGGRCLAGVQLRGRTKKGFLLKKTASNGYTWLRPVSNHDNGEISEDVSEVFHNLDIIKLSNIRSVPWGHQTENVLFQYILKIDSTTPTEKKLKQLCDRQKGKIFGCYGDSIPQNKIGDVDHSLMFIEANAFSGHLKNGPYGRHKRGIFKYSGHQYDLAITDPSYKLGTEEGKSVFLTLSLGIEFKGSYYKLIAGVFCV